MYGFVLQQYANQYVCITTACMQLFVVVMAEWGGGGGGGGGGREKEGGIEGVELI